MKDRNKIKFREQADNGRQLTVWERSMNIKSQFSEMSVGTNDEQVVIQTWGHAMLNQDELKILIEFLQTKIK